MLPPLPIHCVVLDGETATMPVIFEDHYQEPFEYKKRQKEESNLSPTGGKNLLKLFWEILLIPFLMSISL